MPQKSNGTWINGNLNAEKKNKIQNHNSNVIYLNIDYLFRFFIYFAQTKNFYIKIVGDAFVF